MPTRIAILLRALDQGGAQIAMLRLAQGLHRLGYTVTLVALRDSRKRVADLPAGVGYQVLRVPRIQRALPALLRFTHGWQPDVMISALSHTNLLAIACRFLARRPFRVIVTEHAPIKLLIRSQGGWSYRALPALMRLAYPFADAVIGVSDGITAELRAMLPAATRVRRIYNPVFDGGIDHVAHVPVHLPWDGQGAALPIVLGAGRLAPEKDFATLLRAFALLRRRLPARLVILGEGPQRAGLETLAVQLGIAADLHMPGFVENPLSYMRRASVVAITSRFEGFGNVSVEAMACGTPVIATDAPTGPREITENGSWGTLVPVGDAAAIADAIETAIRTPPDPAGPRHRASFFALSTAAAHYADLIQSLAPATPPPLPPVRGRDDEGSAAAQDPIRAANPYGVLGQHPSGRPLHIALYLGDMSGGGAERVSLLLLEEFAKAGARLDLLLHAARGENLGRIPPSVRLLAFNTRRTALDLLPLAAYLRRATPDILLASLNHNNIVAGFARALAGRGTRLLITQHNALSRETREIEAWNYRILPVAYRLAAPFADRIIAVSAGVADDMARTTAIPRDRFAVLYNPVIDADFAARAAEPVAHRWFGPDGPPIFITAGRLAAQKDHATLLRAFALYRQTQPGRLIILGHGPLRQELAALAARLGVAADVDFAGFQHNPLPYYRHCAAFVLSSRYEGFGNVLVEAMGCGLPVIATDCPHGPAEILQNGRFGQLVPVADPAALAQALSLPLRAQFPAAQLRDRAQHFTSQTAASAYLKLMQQTLPPSP